MARNVFTRIVLLVLVFLCGVVKTRTAAATQDALSVAGVLTDAASFQITVTPASYCGKAILIRTEPSHTLLIAAINPAFKRTRDGKRLFKKLRAEKPRVIVETDLPHGTFNVIISPPPASDTRITANVFGTWKVEDGAHELVDFLLFDGDMKDISHHFDISSSIGDSNEEK